MRLLLKPDRMFAEVAFPLPLPQPFIYRVPPGMSGVAVGSRVLAPFGPRRMTGVVTALRQDAAAIEHTKDLLAVLDELPSVSAELFDLVRWMADYYVCSWGEVFRVMMPAGMLSGNPARVRLERHVRFASAWRHAKAVDALRTELRGPRQIAVIESLAGYAAEGLQEPRQSDVLARAGAAASTLRSLVQRGVLEVVEAEAIRGGVIDAGKAEALPERTLHPAQAEALQSVSACIDAGRFHTFLLHGVTGSGKTEVYIEALKQTIRRGRTGIVLVPEIALTPQIVRRFRAHFGSRIAVFHSGMSAGERFDTWRLLRAGRFAAVVGPRSAVLAPLSNLGLLVVDEEHGQSYKQQNPAPRYHARDVAVMRARMNDAVCILGSATPSLESHYNAQRGKYTLLSLPERARRSAGKPASLPDVRIIDLRGTPSSTSLSPWLEDAIGQRLARSEQVILLQNRRGYAPLPECVRCGWSPECEDCSITMVFHKSGNRLRCHYCGRTAPFRERCPNCGEASIEAFGTGTQRVEEELEVRFPEARIVRMDLDTTSAKDAHELLLQRFEEGHADILVGTQMVAKGFDFERVTLVGVINADIGLLLPDFRAEERAYQLLSQVAGRAGRASLPGEVVIQTRNPDRPVLRYARDHDYETFATRQLAERRALCYPPFGRMAGIAFRGPRARDVADLARRWTDALRKEAAGAQVMGPEEAFIGRVKKQYRYHSIVKCRRGDRIHLQEALRTVEEGMRSLPAGCRVNIDIDPVGFF